MRRAGHPRRRVADETRKRSSQDEGIARLITTRRSRNRSSAELYSAVSRICNPLPFLPAGRLAECNSAIQQIENMRYPNSSRAATFLTDGHTENWHRLKPSLAPDSTSRGQCGLNHRSEEHTSELQSRQYLVCRLLLE